MTTGGMERVRVGRAGALLGLAALALLAAVPAWGAVLPPALQEAAELDRALARLEAALGAPEAVAGRSAGPGSVDPEALLAAHDRLRAADLLFRDRLSTVSARLEEIEAAPEIFERLERMEARYDRAICAVLEPLEEPVAALRRAREGTDRPLRKRTGARDLDASLAAARAALEALRTQVPHEILRAAILPYGRLSLAQRTPRAEPAVQPAYLDPLDPAAGPADLAGDPLGPLTDPILLQAEALDHDLVRIFELVRNEIDTEWYAGAMKGAEETLRQGSGNDADQATLLVALLRASGIPARYVRGTAELAPEAIADDLGLFGTAPERVAEALRRAGVPFRGIVRGGRLAAFEVEQVWVAARIPYANYRGALVDLSGPTWIPLAPAIKSYEGTPSAAVLADMAADGELTADAFAEEVLAAPQESDPLSVLRPRAIDYLDRTGGPSYDLALGARSRVPQTLGLLPSSLPFRTGTVTGEWPALPDELVQRVRVVVRSGVGEDGPAVLDWTAPVAELAGRRVTLSYLPATVEDQRVVNAFGGLSAVPLYLVRLRPQINVDGRPRALGLDAVDAGGTHRLEVRLVTPAGEERVGRQVVAGGYYALALGAQASHPPEEGEPEASDTEGEAARILADVGLEYGAAWDAAEEELAGLAGVAVLRPLPSLAIVGNALAVEHVAGVPEQLRWQGVTLDAALRAAEPVPGPESSDRLARGWLELSALQGSALEHRVFQEALLVDAISADKGLGLARAAGIEVLRLAPGDPAADLSQHPVAVRSAVDSWLRLGLEVEIPATPITRKGWRGSVWRVMDAQGRGAGYFIAGGLAGGASTEAPASWIDQFLAALLASPYAPAPNPDPLAAAEVAKVPATDRQEATVGEVYPTPLAVLVRDADGRPVQGAPVTFEVWSGDGSLVAPNGSEGAALTVTTDRLGIASARFRSGRRTEDEPVYVLQRGTDLHATRALMNLVEVSVASRHGAVVPTSPFELLGYPGVPEVLRRTDTDQTVFFFSDRAGRWADTIRVRPEDRFGNPVSNVQVLFQVGDMVSFDGCANGETEPRRNAALFNPRLTSTGTVAACPTTPPLLGECGEPTLSRTTDVGGASAGVILGSSLVSTYQVRASVVGAEPLHFEYRAVFTQHETSGDCGTLGGFRVLATSLADEEGNNIQAARPGRTYTDAVRMTFLHPFHEADVVSEETASGTRFALRPRVDFEWVRVPGEIELQVSNGGSASTPSESPDLVYTTRLTTGPVPGFNALTVVARDFEFPVRRIDSETGFTWVETRRASEFFPDPILEQPVTGVWGVLPALVGVAPDPPVLGPTGQTTEELVVQYGIAPLDYRSSSAEVVLYEDGDRRGAAIGTSRQGLGTATSQRGFAYEIDRTYELELVLNRGSEAEVRSDRFPLRLFQRILEDVSPSVYLSQDVDLVNGRSCDRGDDFRYRLTQDATVTLTVRSVDAVDPDGSLDLGAPQTIVDSELQSEGEVVLTLGPQSFPAGDYRYTLRAVSAVDGRVEEVQGTLRSELRTRDVLPVGHTLVHGVDLWDGHLALSREDLSYPGRGPAPELRRTYSSNAGGDLGPLGFGWTHSYDSHVVVTPCGEVIVIGGEGSGMRFVDDGEGGLRPLAGYHGTLIANTADNSFDFYTKAGTRYRYDLGHGREVFLGSIRDPDGNVTRLVYETDTGGPPRLVAVVGPAGRTLTFHYAPGQFALAEGPVLARVDGPDGSGQSVSFRYDGFGNLVRAEREGGARVETYAYATEPTDPFEDRHVLRSVTDALDSGTTRYETVRGEIRATADVVVPSTFYSAVTLPEGGRTTFGYDTAGLATRTSPELVTRVIDPRSETTAYVLNQYGSPLRITDPLGHETSMTWAADDVVMTSRTDANGTTTHFDYDEHGNLLTETVTIADRDSGEVTLTRSFTYHPPESFDPPHVKDRVATRTDRTGATTSFSYDLHGNLLEERIEVTGPDAGSPDPVVTTHTYLASGDRSSTTDPRGETTRFGYDAYGNLASVTDPVGARTETTYDVRGLPVQVTDPLGRTTSLEYDTLGRLTRRVLPRAAGESAATEETWVYDDAANTVTQTDALGRATTTNQDLEDRVVRVDNAAGGTKLFAYDPAGNKTLESGWFDPSTPRVDTTFVYDAAGRLVERREPLGRTEAFTYDPVGNPVRETLFDREDPGFAPRVTEWQYDGLNRQIEERRLTAGDPVVRRMRYDGEGRLVLETDPLGRETATEYDELGRPIRVREPEGKETVWVYDGAGNPAEERRRNVVDGVRADQVRTFAYDGAGRLVRQTDALGHSTHFEYDLAGNLLRRIDRRLNVTSHAYDARNRRVRTVQHLTRVTELARQVVTELGYDPVGNRTEERWPNGNVVRHTYDALDRKLRTEDALGLVEAATYDAPGNRLTATDGNGNVTTTTYDVLDRPVRVEMPEDRVIERTFDAAGNLLTEKDPRGHTTTFDYDRLDRRVRTTDPAPFGYTTETEYDAAGNVVAETDRRGHITTFEYDGLDRLVRRVAPAPLSHETSFTYDLVGNRISETDPRGITTETRYDLENRPVEVRRAGLTIQETEYDPEGNRRFVTDANGHVTGFEYDERNLLLAENRPLAAITRHTLGDLGDVASIRDPEGRVTTFTYDARRRLTIETDPADATTTFAYDGNGNRTSVTRPEGNSWLYRYDGADRLVEVEDPAGGVTTYTYDGNGNRTSQTDALGHTTSFEHDELDRRTATLYPDTARETYAYDEDGNRTGQTDPKGQTTTWTYDVLDREILRSYGLPIDPAGDDLQSIATEYDPNGNATRITETYTGATGTRVTERAYDAFDRLETVTDPHGETLAYAYDPNGNRTRLTDPDGKVTSYAFDALNRPTAVTGAAGVTEYTYLRDGRLREVRYPNGTVTTNTYDAAGRTATIDNRQGTTPVSSYLYEYDGNGNRIRQVEDNGAGPEETTYAYDPLDRLTEVAYPDRVVAYTYDAAGNRRTETAVDPATGEIVTEKLFDYDPRNRLRTLTDRLDPDGSVAFTHDANGNRTASTKAGATTTYRYSTRDRLVEVREDGALTGSYRYDHQGLRVAKRSGTGDTVRYVYDDQSVLLQTDLAGTTTARYDYGPDRLLSLDHATEGRQFYLFDALGSVVNLTTAAGAIQARYRYDAWGNYRSTAGESPNPFGFTGHERDPETGLYYAKARYYDPELGIFLAEDPFEGDLQNPPSLHRYLYAFGNPTVFVDPTGAITLREVGEITLNTAKGAAADTGRLLVGTADFVTLGSITGARRGIEAFEETEGTLDERLEAAGRAHMEGRIAVVSLGFSEAEDKAAHAKELVGAAAIGRAGDLFGEAVVARDFEKALAATGELLGGTGQIASTALLVAAPVAKAGTIPRPRAVGAGRSAATTQQAAIRTRVLENLAESQSARAASRFRTHIERVEAVVTAESSAGGVRVGVVQTVQSVAPRVARPNPWNEFKSATRGQFASRTEAAAAFRSFRPSIPRRGVTFFDQSIADAVAGSGHLGRPGREVLFLDMAQVRGMSSRADILRATGNAPSVLRAVQSKAPIFGVEFPTRNLAVRPPNPEHFRLDPNFVQGGRTAVGVAVGGRQTGLLLSPFREFATDAFALPRESLIFRFENGKLVPVRRF